MGRLHLFEFEDKKWFPSIIRDYGTDFLQFVTNTFDFYKGVVPLIKKGLRAGDGHRVIDLASGGGGGLKKLAEHLREEIPNLRVVLTDYYPHVSAFQAHQKFAPQVFDYRKDSVSALDVPEDLEGLRTQFLSFHHFRPQEARQILQNAVDRGAPIAIFEGQQRNARFFIQNLFSPITVLLVTPFIRPFKLGRLIFTYLIPIVPLFVMWDGLVSVLRTYSVKEMEEMVAGLRGTEGYDWEIGVNKDGPTPIPYLLGYPKGAVPSS